MQSNTQMNVMLGAALLLLMQCGRTSQAMDLVMYHSERQESGPGWHDLKTVKSSLERAGHKVRLPENGRAPDVHLTTVACALSPSQAVRSCKGLGAPMPAGRIINAS